MEKDGEFFLKKPNIILMMVDQMRYDCIGANGNEIISTPNLDMMVRDGYNFKNAYTAVPTCIASRAALMTGLAQKHHGRNLLTGDIKQNA